MNKRNTLTKNIIPFIHTPLPCGHLPYLKGEVPSGELARGKSRWSFKKQEHSKQTDRMELLP